MCVLKCVGMSMCVCVGVTNTISLRFVAAYLMQDTVPAKRKQIQKKVEKMEGGSSTKTVPALRKSLLVQLWVL